MATFPSADVRRGADDAAPDQVLGVRIPMDEFGTGHSSLSCLRKFPFDKIKIDQSFVRDLSERAASAAFVKAVATMSARLGMDTTADAWKRSNSSNAYALRIVPECRAISTPSPTLP